MRDAFAKELESVAAHDNRVVLLFEALDELFAVRDAADRLNLFASCMRV